MVLRRIFVCALIVMTSEATHGQRGDLQTMEFKVKEQFVDDSLKRLSSSPRVPRGQLGEVQNKARGWRATQSDVDFVLLSDTIHNAAKNGDVKSDVAITSSRGAGATVKYQTLGERQRNVPPTTAKTPTEVVESMFLGMYHIWSERNGVETSDKNSQFDIANAKERVALAEK